MPMQKNYFIKSSLTNRVETVSELFWVEGSKSNHEGNTSVILMI